MGRSLVVKTQERDLADLIVRPIVTEKATTMLELNKYVFDVTVKATKLEIKAAIESLFEVSVAKVNTMRLPRQKKRVGKFNGYKTQYKRAIITLKTGDSLSGVLFPEL